MPAGFSQVKLNHSKKRTLAVQENTAYDSLYNEAQDMCNRASELLNELTDKIDQISAWDIIQTLDQAINNGSIERLKRAVEETSEILGYLEEM